MIAAFVRPFAGDRAVRGRHSDMRRERNHCVAARRVGIDDDDVVGAHGILQCLEALQEAPQPAQAFTGIFAHIERHRAYFQALDIPGIEIFGERPDSEYDKSAVVPFLGGPEEIQEPRARAPIVQAIRKTFAGKDDGRKAVRRIEQIE
jgi:hypothetical protein